MYKGFYSKMAPFIDFTQSFRFLQFHKVKYLNFYEWVLKFRDVSNDVTKWAILRDFR